MRLFLLILMFASGDETEIPGFQNARECIQAGRDAKTEDSTIVSYQCVPDEVPEDE